MHVDSSMIDAQAAQTDRAMFVVLPQWVNDRYPALNELLSAHDVARLTRRPRWLLTGMSLIGRFPKKLKFRGRGIGWRRSEVFEWMARDITIAPVNQSAPRACARKHPRQACLPLECTTSCAPSPACAAHRLKGKCKNGVAKRAKR